MSTRFFSSLVLLLALSLGIVQAQDAPRISLSASGEKSVALTPQHLRVSIPLFAHALSADEAIELLRTRKQAAQERCQVLGSLPDSLRFGGVAIESFDMSSNIRASVLQRMNAMGNAIDVEELPQIVTARVDLVVDWKLPTSDEESLVSFAETIMAGLKDPDITGREQRPEFSPRVEEVMEQIRSQTMAYSGQVNRQGSDEIRYLFVATVTPEKMSEALAGAVLEAKTRIEALSKAAELKMIAMVSMSSSTPRFVNTSYSPMRDRARRDLLVPNDNEVMSAIPGEMEYTAQVQMQYTVSQ